MSDTLTEGQLREFIGVRAQKDAAFRTSLKSDAKSAVEGVLGSSLPANVSVRIIEDSDSTINIVIPTAAGDELSEDELESVAGGILDAKGMGSSVLGDGIFCMNGGLINSKMEINL